MDGGYRHIFKYTGLFGAVQALGILVGMLRGKAVAVLLGHFGVGLLSVCNAAAAFLENATNLGLQTSWVSVISQSWESGDGSLERNIRLLRSWSLVAAALGVVACLALGGALGRVAFSSGEYGVELAWLSPVIGLAAITGGEVAILKGTRRLRELAAVSVVGAAVSLAASLPLWVVLGRRGIVPSLVVASAVQFALTVWCSWRHYPPGLRLGVGGLRGGGRMVRVGLAFVVAGVFGSGAEFLVRSFLSGMSVSLAGLYSAGYTITVVYAGMVFASMDADYYPRLSAACRDAWGLNLAVNRQIEAVCIMLSPMLAALAVALPVVVPLLFSAEFAPVVGMSQAAVMAMFFRGVNLPVAYVLLAKGDSWAYMAAELVYSVCVVLSVMAGFSLWGLDGTGIGLSVSVLVECVCVVSYCRWRHGLRLRAGLLRLVAAQLVAVMAAVGSAMALSGAAYVCVGVVMVAVSAGLSAVALHRWAGHTATEQTHPSPANDESSASR